MSEYSKRKNDQLLELSLVDEPSGLLPWEAAFCREYMFSGSALEAFKKVCCVYDLKDPDDQLKRRAVAMLKKPAVMRYIKSLNKRLEDLGVARILEVQTWLTDAIRTPIGMINQNDPLCQRHKITRRTMTQKDGSTETVTTEEFESVSKLEAAKILIRMKGWDAPIKIDVEHRGGVMLVPMASSSDEWEKMAVDAQAKLMAETIDV